MAAHDRRARGWRQKPNDHFHGRGFAGAVRPEKTKYLTGPGTKADIVDDGLVTEGLGQALNG
jgi:hypothetical protein